MTAPRMNRTVLSRLGLAVGVGIVLLALAGYDVGRGSRRFAAVGSGFPGGPTALTQILGQFAGALTASVCLGALVIILSTAVPDASGRLDPATYRVHLVLERVAPLWAVLATVMAVVDAATRAGAPALRLATSSALFDAIAAAPTARGWCVAAGCAVLLAVGVRFTVRWNGHLLLAIPTLIGIVAVPVTGNAGEGSDHDIATSAAIVFAVALAVVTGVHLMAALTEPSSAARRRLTLVTVTAGVTALLYGAVLARIALAGTPLLGSDYGLLTTAGAVLLAAVVLFDVAQLRRTDVGERLRILMAVCATAVTAVVGVLAVLTPPRFFHHPFTVSDIYLGYNLPGPVSVATLATTWRIDPFLGTAALVLAIAYLLGVRRLLRRGDHWPVGRTIAWTAGCLTLLLATSSGVRAYGSAMFSVHMAEHMTLNMFIPVVLVLGAPVTLALRALPPAAKGAPPGPREWVLQFVHAPVTRVLSHPVTAFVLFTGSLYAVYFTPLFDTLVRYHWGHELMSVHFLLTGYLFFWGIIGIDPGPKRLPFLGRLGLLFAVMPFHAFFGIATMTMTNAMGDDFYRSLGLHWVPSLSDDQHLGGAIAWGSSELPVIIVVIALVTQWARQDRRAGARADRHSDDGYDDDLDAYNAMLAELARQRR
jgi:cytochrome c oxidase assembly factor CtaG